MSKKLWRKINILGHDYKIYKVPEGYLDGHTVGETRHPDREIYLDASLKGENMFLILLHEIWHAKQYECGDTQILQSQTMERDCELFASFISSMKKQGVL